MARRRQGERVLGPYKEAEDKFRIIEIDEKGERFSSVFPGEKEAEIYKAELLGELAVLNQTTSTALDEYRDHLKSKGNKPDSIRQTCWAIKMFFPQPIAFDGLTPKKCAALYDALRTRALPSRQPHGFEGPPEPTFLSVDSHRGILSQARTFLAWCIERGYLRGANPLENVKGVGKRRPRGKSLGKSGNELRVKEARAWYAKALELADGDDQGAIAALVALLLGLRANEIVSRKVADLDDDEAPGDLLWIPCSKTPAGRRTLEVPEVLRPLLLACAEGKSPDRYLFECEREQDAIGKPHVRDWVLDQVHRVCDAAKVPRVTAHAMRGLLATLTAERGLAGHMIAATLGHEDERITMQAYAAPGSAATGVNRLGLKVLNGGVQVRRNAAK
jgi:integrase